ncbi:hypothetical protein BH11PSE10_BH11PSE10_09130 [soil metagenome]
MKLNQFAAIAAIALSGVAASAATLTPVAVGASFTDVQIGSITIGSASDLVGNVFALDTVTGSFWGMPISFTLQQVTFSGAGVGSLVGDTDASAAGFAFSNVAAGNYTVKASGVLSGPAQISGTGFVGASYTVTAVPEPETYALMLAGLGAVAFVARRRKAV